MSVCGCGFLIRLYMIFHWFSNKNKQRTIQANLPGLNYKIQSAWSLLPHHCPYLFASQQNPKNGSRPDPWPTHIFNYPMPSLHPTLSCSTAANMTVPKPRSPAIQERDPLLHLQHLRHHRVTKPSHEPWPWSTSTQPVSQKREDPTPKESFWGQNFLGRYRLSDMPQLDPPWSCDWYSNFQFTWRVAT